MEQTDFLLELGRSYPRPDIENSTMLSQMQNVLGVSHLKQYLTYRLAANERSAISTQAGQESSRSTALLTLGKIPRV